MKLSKYLDRVVEGNSASSVLNEMLDEKSNPVYGKIPVVWVGRDSQQMKSGEKAWISNSDYDATSGNKKVWVMDDPKLDTGFFAFRSDVSDGEDAFISPETHNNQVVMKKISQLRA